VFLSRKLCPIFVCQFKGSLQKNGPDSRSVEPGLFFPHWHPKVVENRSVGVLCNAKFLPSLLTCATVFTLSAVSILLGGFWGYSSESNPPDQATHVATPLD
jgi:hypothetical protein